MGKSKKTTEINIWPNIPTNESKDKLKKNQELRNKITDLVRSITSYSDNYDEKCMKIKFNPDDKLSLKKMLQCHINTTY